MAENLFFSRLKRLFSTDVIIRSENGKDLKVIDSSHIQASGKYNTNSIYDKYNRIFTGGNTTSLYGTQLNQNYQYLRTQLYSEYDVMDNDAIIASALDIISDESSLKNDMGEVIQIKSSDEDIQRILYNLFYDVLNIEFNLWSWIRQMCKYGDFFLKLEIAEKLGVYNVIPYTAFHIERLEGYDKNNPQSIKYKFNPEGISTGASSGYHNFNPSTTTANGIYFDNYEMAHFRLIADVNYMPYGRSYLEPGRQLFKQYSMMEDAMLIHRITRAAEKRVFFINIGNVPPEQVDAFMQKTVNSLKRSPHMDPNTGQYNLRFNLQNMLEDFYIPVRNGDSTTKIETAKGLDYDGIKDVEYLRDKLFAALKVPKAFMGYEKDLCIALDTKIPLLDGRILTAQEIINEYELGKKNYVYSIDEDTKNIVPGEIEWAGLTRLDTQTIKVWLDNDEFIQCTPDHNFLTRDGEWKEAQDLKEGEALMPLYLQKSIKGYTQVYNPNTGKYEYVHRLVANYYGLKQDNKVIHHIDFNKLNNNPENLNCSMSFPEHNEWKEKYSYKNHKVTRIEWIQENIDTCDLTISKYHNFGTNAGVIIHNSGKATLAAQDIRFARTIDRIQRIILSELYKIALVHLYSQGIRGENLTNFELSLTTPSIIYDQEKVALLKEKVDLAKSILETKLLPTDWIYNHVFHLSEDQYDEYRDLIKEDQAREFRYNQILEEGNDPLASGKSYGTPHDLATLYGRGRYQNNSAPTSGDEAELGRPEEKASNINTQASTFGKDRLGRQSMKKDDGDESTGIRTNYKGGSPLALESLMKNKNTLDSYDKKLVFTTKNEEDNLLNEKQIKE